MSFVPSDSLPYPEKEVVTKARDLMTDVLSQRKDNVALLKRMVQRQDDLLDSVEDLEGVELFFKSQRPVYDDARHQMDRVNKERDYFATDAEALDVFHTIATILSMPKPYDRIGELPELVSKVKAAYAWNFPAFKEVLRRFLAYMAYLVELLLGYEFGVFFKYLLIRIRTGHVRTSVLFCRQRRVIRTLSRASSLLTLSDVSPNGKIGCILFTSRLPSNDAEKRLQCLKNQEFLPVVVSSAFW